MLDYLPGGNAGLLHGGGWYLLGVQALGVLTMTVWSGASTAIFFFVMEKTMGLRVEVGDGF